jgi:hypothetical protein
MHHYFIKIIKKIYLYRWLHSSKKREILQRLIDLKIRKLLAKISKYLFYSASLFHRY